MPRSHFRIPLIACAASVAITVASRADDSAKPGRHPIARPGASARTPDGSTSGGSTLVAVGVAAALAAFGAVAFFRKRAKANPGSANLRVVGRASLSPRHAVYLLRVGDRTLILGTGGPGPPSLLGEIEAAEPIDDAPQSTPAAIPRPHVAPTRAGGAA